MGGANTECAVKKVIEIAEACNISNLKIAYVTGDDITGRIRDYNSYELLESGKKIEDVEKIVSANVYLSAEGIKEALDAGADIVITGRVADPSLFVGPILHEFNWSEVDYDKIGQAMLTGHMLECCAQLTGGYYADPGFKDVPAPHRLGHPIAEIDEDANLFFTKAEGSGGIVCVDVCKEQMLYEIGDPSCYITPDGIADFSHVTFKQGGKDKVIAKGATSRKATDTFKVNVAYLDGFFGTGEISYGGTNSLKRAQLATDIIKKRWEIIGVEPEEARFDYTGYNSLYGDAISSEIKQGNFTEIRLRVAVRTKTEENAKRLIRELQCMYINGPAGGSGITSNVQSVLCVENILVPKIDVPYQVHMETI